MFFFAGGAGETMAILWLEGDVSSSLRIFPTSTAQCLFRSGHAQYPAVHPDFLSRRGIVTSAAVMNPETIKAKTVSSLSHTLTATQTSTASGCFTSTASFEEIPSRSGRLVIVREQLPVHMVVGDVVSSTRRSSVSDLVAKEEKEVTILRFLDNAQFTNTSSLFVVVFSSL